MKKSKKTSSKNKKPRQIWQSRRFSRILTIILLVEALVLAAIIGAYVWSQYHETIKKLPIISNAIQNNQPTNGKIITTEKATTYSKIDTEALIKQTNKTFDLNMQYGMTKQVFSYQSTDARNNDQINVYGRIYVPTNIPDNKKLPILAFAPGTTGIADQCAASLEDPAKRNWANYDSLLAAYASQGYIVVTTDYEGMRDNSRMHHYMIGEQEGRALLDSARALKNLKLTKDVADFSRLSVGGYSQGGHAALWADKIRAQYAPELTIDGVVGFGPVSSVKQTLDDNVHGANIDWFGPYILTSYSDYYHHTYPVNAILLPKWTQNLTNDVMNSCIDTVQHVWGSKADLVYTPQFLPVMKSGNYTNEYQQFGDDMDKNLAGDQTTSSAKLINQGGQDNVILPAQSKSLFVRLCQTNPNTTMTEYKNATHYNTMVTSFKDTLNWLNNIGNGKLSGNCSITS